MKGIRFLQLVAIAALILVSLSCSRFDDFKLDNLDTEVEFEPSIVLPLAYGSFNLQDLLEAFDSTGIVSQTGDSLLFIYYLDTAYSVTAEEIVDIPNKASTETYIESDVNTPAWALLPDGDEMTFSKIEIMDFEIQEGDQIDIVLLKDGQMNIVVNSSFMHSGTLLMTSPNIFDPNGDSLMLEFVISEADGTFHSDSDYPLEGYSLEIDEDAGMAFIRVNYLLTLKKEPGNGISIDDEAGIEINFDGMEFSHVYGFVSEREVLNVNQTLNLDFFDIASLLQDITLKEPEFNLHVYNSYGIPMLITLEEITGRSTSSGTELELEFVHDSMKKFKVGAPNIDDLGQTDTSFYSINTSNSNLSELLQISPNKMDFHIIANTGLTPLSGDQNFVLDTSTMDIVAEVVLPMWLQTGGYALQDSIDFNLDSIIGEDFANMLEYLKLSFVMKNELPLEVRLQGYFLDSTETVIDSLFLNGDLPLLEAAQVDDNGEIIYDLISEILLEIEFTEEKLSVLPDARYLWFKADASTTDHGTKFVKFYSFYELHYQLSIDAEFRINSDELNFGSEE